MESQRNLVASYKETEDSPCLESGTPLLAWEHNTRASRSKWGSSTAGLFCVWTFRVLAIVLLAYCASVLSSASQAALVKNGSSSTRAWHSCGNSLEEARAQGCHFDAMTWEWYPSACADAELSDEIIQAFEWRYYTKQRAWEEDRVPIEDVVAGKYQSLWVPMEYHMRHCTYLWRKMHRAILNHKLLDSDLASYGHTKHCEEVLLGDWDRNLMNTEVKMSYATCLIT